MANPIDTRALGAFLASLGEAFAEESAVPIGFEQRPERDGTVFLGLRFFRASKAPAGTVWFVGRGTSNCIGIASSREEAFRMVCERPDRQVTDWVTEIPVDAALPDKGGFPNEIHYPLRGEA